MTEYLLYSDGGAELGVRAAGAVVVVDVETSKRLGAVAFLGPGTNNEAEIVASLIGFSFLLQRTNRLHKTGAKINWTSDSEYVLKSATQYIKNWQRNGWKTADKKPVKNQGLWQAFSMLSNSFVIVPEHVRGHTGHPENEACDAISTWAQEHGAAVLDTDGEVFVPDIGTGIVDRWLLIDGRSFIAGLRNNEPTDKHKLFLVRRFEELGVIDFDAVTGVSPASSKVSSGPARDQAQLRNKISEALSLADRVGGSEEIKGELEKLLKKL